MIEKVFGNPFFSVFKQFQNIQKNMSLLRRRACISFTGKIPFFQFESNENSISLKYTYLSWHDEVNFLLLKYFELCWIWWIVMHNCFFFKEEAIVERYKLMMKSLLLNCFETLLKRFNQLLKTLNTVESNRCLYKINREQVYYIERFKKGPQVGPIMQRGTSLSADK